MDADKCTPIAADSSMKGLQQRQTLPPRFQFSTKQMTKFIGVHRRAFIGVHRRFQRFAAE
jgi:hypothetical protein